MHDEPQPARDHPFDPAGARRDVRLARNPRAASADAPYGADLQSVLDSSGFDAARQEISSWPGYAHTPLIALPGLAHRLGVGSIHYKDEGKRFTLKSFKALGGAYAVMRILLREIRNHGVARKVTSRDLLGGIHVDITRDVTVACATDGNHGLSVAWGARIFGCRCVIFVHGKVSEERRRAISAQGADVLEVPGNYDDSVRYAASAARRYGWFIVSDTSHPGYLEIPRTVMHGYGVVADEIVAQYQGLEPPSHLLVQAGVGGLAAALYARFWQIWKARRPELIVVEPTSADCIFQSVVAGKPVRAAGDLDTLMAGLACGEASTLAWPILQRGASACLAIDDQFAAEAVRTLASAAGDDPPVVAGETGGAGLAALLAVQAHPEFRAQLALDETSRVLLIGSEGDTDPEIYRRIVHETADAASP